MEAMIGQIFKGFPFWLATVTMVFFGILLIIWLLLPLWVLFIQWNTGKMKDEIRRLADLIEKKDRHERKQESSEPRP